MKKPKVTSTQYYNWNYCGRAYRFVVQEDGEPGTYEISLEINPGDTWSISVFKHSMVCSSMPSFKSITELAMRYFAEMFGIEYPETAGLHKANFLDDPDKMKDLLILSKEDFLKSYSYITEEEYNETLRIYHNIVDAQAYSLKHGGDDVVLEDEAYEELGRLE